jgi:hypothetical protein
VILASHLPTRDLAYVLALGDGVEIDLDLGHGQNVGRGGHVDQEFYFVKSVSSRTCRCEKDSSPSQKPKLRNDNIN